MNSRPHISAPPSIDDPILADLVEELTAQLQAGRFIDLSKIALDYPEYEESLRGLLPALQALAGAAHSPSSGGVPAECPGRERRLPLEKLGDYRLIREIGRGGMGVVYEAEQLSLNRRVAVKILALAAALDPRQRQRFLNEARAAALLHHANIVPVFGVGCEQGVHYYVMQYIEGHTLAQVISDLRASTCGLRSSTFDLRSSIFSGAGRLFHDPMHVRSSRAFNKRSKAEDRRSNSTIICLTTERSITSGAFFRSVATLGIQAAQGLEYAHEGGLVHRDVKPANLLIDARGNLWITDFGLARLPGDTGLTQTGDLLGTLRYMSPEQAQSRRGLVDHRTDIYSLGVTLYELLTLQPLFTEKDRAELLERILNAEPMAPRRLNRAIPVELETIVLKAVAKNPVERYATAQEMADDLGRFLADKPILARRPGLFERAGKWLRRHRSVVRTAVAFVLVAAVAGACGMVYLARARAEAERGRELARRAADEMYTQVAEKWLASQPYLEPLQREFLLRALAFYQEFSLLAGEDRTARREAAIAFRRVGDIERRLGETAKARAAYREAGKRLEALSAEDPPDPICRAELASLLNQSGDLYRLNGELGDALLSHERALGLFEELAARQPNVADYRFGLAGSNNNLGLVLQGLHEDARAEKAFRRAIDLFRELTRSEPDQRAHFHFLALAHANLAVLLRDTTRVEDAERESYRAVRLWKNLLVAHPAFPQYRQGQGVNYLNLGMLLEKTRGPREANEAYCLAVTLLEKLTAEFPSVPIYAEQLRDARRLLESLKNKSKGAHS
jgi:serine/threonine protein kinase